MGKWSASAVRSDCPVPQPRLLRRPPPSPHHRLDVAPQISFVSFLAHVARSFSVAVFTGAGLGRCPSTAITIHGPRWNALNELHTWITRRSFLNHLPWALLTSCGPVCTHASGGASGEAVVGIDVHPVVALPRAGIPPPRIFMMYRVEPVVINVNWW